MNGRTGPAIISAAAILWILGCTLLATPAPFLSCQPVFVYLDPAWSPDGKHIAYAGMSDTSTANIYVMDSDGTNTKLLMTVARAPAWSPDGSQIVYASDQKETEAIYLMNADGTKPQALTNGPKDGAPAWSPDGKLIAFGSEGNIAVMNSDGSGVALLTEERAVNWYPSWSPDGKQIVYKHYLNSKNDIVVMNADGSEPRQITTLGSFDDPMWSPDGTQIVAANYPAGIQIMNPDGTSVRVVLIGTSGGYPAWSPDGKRIAFVSHRERFDEIYAVDSDGANLTRLTNNPGNMNCYP